MHYVYLSICVFVFLRVPLAPLDPLDSPVALEPRYKLLLTRSSNPQCYPFFF